MRYRYAWCHDHNGTDWMVCCSDAAGNASAPKTTQNTVVATHIVSAQPPTSMTRQPFCSASVDCAPHSCCVHDELCTTGTLLVHPLHCLPFRPSPCRAVPRCGGRSCWSSLSWSYGVTWWCGGRGRWVVVVVVRGVRLVGKGIGPAHLSSCTRLGRPEHLLVHPCTRTPTLSWPAMPYLPAAPPDSRAVYNLSYHHFIV